MRKQIIFKSSILIIVLAIFMSNCLFAQPKEKHPKMANSSQITNMLVKLAEEISLSEKQHQEIQELFITHFSEVREKMESNKKKHKIEREKMEEQREEFEGNVKSLLNEDQQSKFDDFMERQREHHKQNKPRQKKQ